MPKTAVYTRCTSLSQVVQVAGLTRRLLSQVERLRVLRLPQADLEAFFQQNRSKDLLDTNTPRSPCIRDHANVLVMLAAIFVEAQQTQNYTQVDADFALQRRNGSNNLLETTEAHGRRTLQSVQALNVVVAIFVELLERSAATFGPEIALGLLHPSWKSPQIIPLRSATS